MMIRISITLPKEYKKDLDRLSKKLGISKSELIRLWIRKEKDTSYYCPNCPDGIFYNCKYYVKNNPLESHCITDSSVGYCILEQQKEV